MYIVKVGGGESINLRGIADDLASLDESVVVVLGANALRDRLAETMGAPKQVLTSVSGYSSVYSDEQAIDIIMMSYAGVRIRRFVEICQRAGVNAIGLCGLDGRLVRGERNKGIRVREGGKTLLKRDFSGKPRRANAALVTLLVENGYVPVITIPIMDENGFAINSENDDIVNVLQNALHASRIIQLIEAPGFLESADDPDSMIPALTRADVERREQRLEGRVKRKLLALKHLLDSGAAQVIMSDGRTEHPVRDALNGKGTTIG